MARKIPPQQVEIQVQLRCSPNGCAVEVQLKRTSQGPLTWRHEIKISIALRRATDIGARARWPRMFGATMRGRRRGLSGNAKDGL